MAAPASAVLCSHPFDSRNEYVNHGLPTWNRGSNCRFIKQSKSNSSGRMSDWEGGAAWF